jgi:hypothetical protein
VSSLAGPETLPRLGFAVAGAEAVRYAAAPTVALALRIESDRPIRSLSLNTQIRIVPARRGYDAAAEERLVELFGAPERWGETLRGFLWAHVSLVVPQFEHETFVPLHVPCTYDLEVAAAKYFSGLEDGEVPLDLLFSGTAFHLDAGGLLRATQVPWEGDAQFRLPVATWRQAIDQHFPGSAWLRLRRDAFEQLVAYKAQRLLPTWEAVVAELLEGT